MVKLQEKESTISDSEWEAMRIIWTLEPVSSTKIIEELQAKKDWSESTIKTLLRRLVKKNLLSTKKEGRRFVYTAKVNQTQVMAEAAQELLNCMCDMHKGEVLLQLLTDSPISKSDLAKMQQVISEKEKIPQLWKNKAWAKEFASFIIELVGNSIPPEIIEIHPPFNDYCKEL